MTSALPSYFVSLRNVIQPFVAHCYSLLPYFFLTLLFLSLKENIYTKGKKNKRKLFGLGRMSRDEYSCGTPTEFLPINLPKVVKLLSELTIDTMKYHIKIQNLRIFLFSLITSSF